MVQAITRRNGGSAPRMFGSMQREMERLFEDVFGSRGSELSAGGAWFAPLTLWEEGNKFHIAVELPGVESEDIDATIENGTLRIVAVRKETETEEGQKYWHEERRYGSVVRTVALPDTVDADSIEADLSDGVLHLTLAKRPEAQPKRIEVKTK